MIVPDSGFDCSRHAQDKAGADLLKIMLVPMLRNRPTPSQILAFMGTLGLRHTPSPVEMSTGKEEQFAQARLEIEALKYELAESRKREVDANARADSKTAGNEALKHDVAGARSRDLDAEARSDTGSLIVEPVRAHRELTELRNTHARVTVQQIHTPTRSEGSPDRFVPPSEREALLSTRLREASHYEAEAAWMVTRGALQRETEAAWRETQAALREKEVKEAEARIEREAARKEIAAVRAEFAVLRAERDAALKERDAALKEAAQKETALAVAQAVRDTESRMAAELMRHDQDVMAQWHLGLPQHDGAGLPNLASSAQMEFQNTGRALFGDTLNEADLRESMRPLVGPAREGGSGATRAGIAQPRPSRPASANADSRIRASPYQQPQRLPQQRIQNQNRRRG